MGTTDQEMIAIEKIVCYSVSKGGTHHALKDHIEKHLGWSGGRERKGGTWARGFIVVSLGKNRQSRVCKFWTG